VNRSGTGRVQHQAVRLAMPGTARTPSATAPMASRGNSFRNANTGMTRAKAKAAQKSPEDDQDDEGHDDREPLLPANDAEIDDPTTDDDGKLIGHDPEEDDDGNENTDPKGKKTKG
jgi:hypothetical protein